MLLTGPLAAMAEALPVVKGKVTQVMADSGKVVINHGPIPNLDMGSMTMVFKAKETGLLKGLKPGDKVSFTAIDEGGKLIITTIKKGE